MQDCDPNTKKQRQEYQKLKAIFGYTGSMRQTYQTLISVSRRPGGGRWTPSLAFKFSCLVPLFVLRKETHGCMARRINPFLR